MIAACRSNRCALQKDVASFISLWCCAFDEIAFMSLLTFRVLDGADRGRTFSDVSTPITIGREEGNPIQLNDDRISRYHLKIQEDNGKLVLTDLESTNGTKVNGETVQIWILRPGDVISMGRSTLLFGTREEIAKRLAAMRGADILGGVTMSVVEELDSDSGSAALDFELNFSEDPDAEVLLHTLMPPEIPGSMTPGQTAELAEIFQYLHLRIRGLIDSVRSKGKTDRVTLDLRQWENLVDIQDRLASYLREIGEPTE